MNNIIIRYAEKKDIPEIIDLCKEHAEYENADYYLLDQYEALSRAITSNSPTMYCIVVEKDNYLIGYCTYTKEFSTWTGKYYIHMDCLYLKEYARNMGIGKKIFERMITHVKELQISEVQWQTPIENHNAIRFYKRLGANSKKKVRFFFTISKL